jgi:dipeptidyl aminopeptidase/acylaminoacyl peptidase
METDQGLWAANPDGSGVVQITEDDFWYSELQRAVQPQGNLVVFRSPANYDWNHMALNLISFPDGTITRITDLTSPETEAYLEQENYPPLMAVLQDHGYAWSPDGTRLAFIGLMDGPSAEVYLYDVPSGDITRVSYNDEQDYWVSWSPDGNSLLYFSAGGFGTGAGFDTTGVWVAKGDGSDASFLFTPEGKPEEIVGWLDNTTVVLDSWNMHCGSAKLRLYDLTSRQATMLSEDCVTGAAASARYGAVLFSNESGLYLLTNEDRTPVQIDQEPNISIDPWEEPDMMFTLRFDGGGIATYNTVSEENNFTESPIELVSYSQDVAMYGAIWGWTSEDDSQPGVWITGPGLEIGQIFTGKARMPIWSEDNNLLFFSREESGGYSIYGTTFWGYYQDLTLVGFVDAQPFYVTWLGNER